MCLVSTVPQNTVHMVSRLVSADTISAGVIGYWSSVFAAIVLCEHFVFRQTWSAYKVSSWNKASLLPPGFAAVLAFFCGFGIIVPTMSQTWYVGPIARAVTGDIGIMTGSSVAALAYLSLRSVERRLWPGR